MVDMERIGSGLNMCGDGESGCCTGQPRFAWEMAIILLPFA